MWKTPLFKIKRFIYDSTLRLRYYSSNNYIIDTCVLRVLIKCSL